MNDLQLHGVAVYNPGLWSRTELKQFFVARTETFNRILDDLRREREDSPPQHRLILGLRGMGKSTLLRRIGIAVEEDKKLGKQWQALNFPEEQYNIGSLIDLWVNCLDAIGDALEENGKKDQAAALDKAIEDLPPQDDKAALSLLLSEAKKLDRRLLLLIDNIDLVFDRLKDDHWSLREVFQSEPQLMIIGASAKAIEASYKYDAAFYDFFKVDELKGLTEPEMHTILTRLSELGRTPHVTELMKKDPARIKTLHTLTGGNPRTIVLLYNVLVRGLDGDVRSDLEGLLDLVTPLYKARFEEFPQQAQQLVDGLAVHWDPMTARQLAQKLGWDVNKTSSQLNRLQQQAVVEKVKPASGKRAAFQIGERFFNIWYLMRASRRVRRKLIWLVHFLRMFFNAEELQEHARRKLQENGCHTRDAEYNLALAQAVENAPMRAALENHALHTLFETRTTRNKIFNLLDLQGDDAELLPKVERISILKESKEKITQALNNKTIEFDIEQFCFWVLGSPSLDLNTKQIIAKKAQELSAKQWHELHATLSNEWKKWVKAFKQHYLPLYTAIGSGIMANVSDFAGAEAASVRDNSYGLVAIAWSHWLRINTPDSHQMLFAEESYRKAIEVDPNDAYPWNGLGNLLSDHLKRYDDAEEAYRKAIEVDPNYAYPWYGLGNLLTNHLKRYDDAEEAYRKAIEVDPNLTDPWYGLGNLLTNHLKRYDDAEEAYRKAIEVDPNLADPWYGLGNLLSDHLKRYDDAEEAYRKAIEVDPNDASSWNSLAWFFYKRQKNLPEAMILARKSVELSKGGNLYYVHTLATILISQGHWQEAEPHINNLLKSGDEDFFQSTWSDMLLLFREVVYLGRSKEALKLVDNSSASERWRPLREAIAAIAEENIDLLNGVAPEIRAPALEIIKIIAPDLDT